MNPAIELLAAPNQVLSTLCPIHGYPFIKMGTHQICKACANENLEQSKLQHQKDLNNRLLQSRIKGACLSHRYMQCGFSNYIIATDEQKHVVECCQRFTEQFLNGSKSNLIIFGTPGSGKTHLSSAIIRNVIHRSKLSARYVTSSYIAQTIMNSWNITDQSEEQWINFFADFDLLVIDEYGLHDRHTTRLELIHKVLYRRYDLLKPTIIISNFTLKDLEQDLGVRLWSRLHENQLLSAACYWADYRMT